ncbi:Pex19 protein family-domain-containing protein [Cyathus striatus]|nr:Pex19 protein family-domain-containing protein [Cyathus striatus]
MSKPVLNNPKANVDDDLDELDDVLDEFTSPPPPPNTSLSPTFKNTTRPRTNTRVDAPPKSIPSLPLHPALAEQDEDEDAMSAEFTKELARGMESLMREITSGEVDDGRGKEKGTGEGNEEEERTKAFKAAWEAMLLEGEGGLAGLKDVLGEENKPQAGVKAKEPPATGDFQSRLKQAMEKIKESESDLQTGPGEAAPNPEALEALLASLKDLGLDGEDGDGEPDEGELAGFLENMMGQLMNKEVLYEPLKELADSFPPYLASPPAPLTPEDKTRYEKQLVCVRKIVALFDEPGYDDNNEKNKKGIVELMSEMQSYGTPPSELMGPLPPGFESMGSMGDGECAIM